MTTKVKAVLANEGAAQARWEKQCRKLLSQIAEAGEELAVMFEFKRTASLSPEDYPLHEFGYEVLTRAQSLMTNFKGELDLPTE